MKNLQSQGSGLSIEYIEPIVPVEIFHEELTDILQEMENHLSVSDEDHMIELKRLLHTLKGSARLVGFVHLGEYVHSIETKIEKQSLQANVDDLKAMTLYLRSCEERILNKENINPFDDLMHSSLSEKNELIHKNFNLQDIEKMRISLSSLELLSQQVASSSIARSHLQHLIQNIRKTLDDISGDLDKMKTFENEFSSRQSCKFFSETLSLLLGKNRNLIENIQKMEDDLYLQKNANLALEQGLVEARMVSFKSLVPRFENMVKTISQTLHKEVRLTVEAEGEMDRSLVQKLITPIEHLLRNAIDHGIETQERRLALKKPTLGHIRLSLVRQGAYVIIRLKDDGKGIDLDSVKERAVKQGLISSEMNCDRNELIKMIFRPGFSTSEKVNQISGRGIGMDIVSHEIKKVGGHITVDTKRNEGTEFQIQLPFTVSMNHALIFQDSQQYYGLLVSHVSGITRISNYELSRLFTISYMGVSYPLKRLSDMLNRETKESRERDTFLPVLLMNVQNHLVALVVDKVIGLRDVIVKSLGSQLHESQEILGVSLLADGSMVLMLDALAIAEKVIYRESEMKKFEFKNRSVLVVDDSPVIREAYRTLLEKKGMKVVMASDGLEALFILTSLKPDAILLDIEMPNMNGFCFLERYVKDEKNTTPVIVISSNISADYQKKAYALGAIAYLHKPFNQEEVIETLAHWMNMSHYDES